TRLTDTTSSIARTTPARPDRKIMAESYAGSTARSRTAGRPSFRQIVDHTAILLATMGPTRKPRRHFSMLRSFHLADFITIANAFCGVAAIFEAMKYFGARDARHLYLAALLVPVALVFDVLDGRIARWRHTASPMGRELDSLADVISFG